MTIQPAHSYADAQRLMFEDLPKTPRQAFMRAGSLERSKAFFEMLGNPQNNRATIHIAGTSGKGSIANIIECLLRAHGKTTCLHVSPHVYDVRERLSINGGLVSKDSFVSYINALIPAIESMNETIFGRPTYYEVSTALGFLAADAADTDYTVLETGLGGLYDSSNTITRSDKFAVLGRMGLDHVPILANPAELIGTEVGGLMPAGIEGLETNLERITAQKAGILPFDGQAVALEQEPVVKELIQKIAKFRKTSLHTVNNSEFVSYNQTKAARVYIDVELEDTGLLHNVEFALPGKHQLENLRLALAAVQDLAKRDGWQLSEEAIRQALRTVWLPGRFEVRKLNGKTIILDGSHNPQKMQALVATFQESYPDKKAAVVMAMNKSKDVEAVLKMIAPISENITCTDFFTEHQDFLSKSLSAAKLADIARDVTMAHVRAAESQRQAIHEALESDSGIVLVTGSFYFLGEVNDTLKTL